MKSHGKWTGWLAYFYYFSGSAYYAYHWLLLAGGVSLLAGGAFAYYKVPVLTAAFLVVAFCFLLTGISFWRKIAKIRLCSHNPALRLERMKIDYRLIDSRSSDYFREVEAEVLFPTESYQAKFYWSGQGHVDVEPIKGSTAGEVLEDSNSSHNFVRLHFGQTLAKGVKHCFLYKMTFREAAKPVRPFLGHTVDSPLGELLLQVQLSPDYHITKYKRQIFINAYANLPLWEEDVEMSNPQTRQLEWPISRPQHHCYYRLSW